MGLGATYFLLKMLWSAAYVDDEGSIRNRWAEIEHFLMLKIRNSMGIWENNSHNVFAWNSNWRMCACVFNGFFYWHFGETTKRRTLSWIRLDNGNGWERTDRLAILSYRNQPLLSAKNNYDRPKCRAINSILRHYRFVAFFVCRSWCVIHSDWFAIYGAIVWYEFHFFFGAKIKQNDWHLRWTEEYVDWFLCIA